MKAICRRYLQILAIELDDLAEDIEALAERAHERVETLGLSERVLRENQAVFDNELIGIDDFRRLIDGTDPSAFSSLDAMMEALRDTLRRRIHTCGLAPAIYGFIDRKMCKVESYVRPGATVAI